MTEPRRFPPPWSAEEGLTYFIVPDANGQKLTYVYFESQEGRRAAAKLPSHDEARRIAANIAKPTEHSRRPRAVICLIAEPGQPFRSGRQSTNILCTALLWGRHLRRRMPCVSPYQ
jgi:hypothetical protein